MTKLVIIKETKQHAPLPKGTLPTRPVFHQLASLLYQLAQKKIFKKIYENKQIYVSFLYMHTLTKYTDYKFITHNTGNVIKMIEKCF